VIAGLSSRTESISKGYLLLLLKKFKNGAGNNQGNSGRNDYFGHSSKRITSGRADQNASNRKINSKNYNKEDLLAGTAKPANLENSRQRGKSAGKGKIEVQENRFEL
jgi:hypothetical protein